MQEVLYLVFLVFFFDLGALVCEEEEKIKHK